MSLVDHPLTDVVTVHRPWGDFRQFLANAPASVKIITVDVQHRLSLQRHRLRDELWHVIDGPVDVEVDGVQARACEGELVWIPRGTVHRMGNSSGARVRVLELAFGHFDEDDIERLQDDYDRGAPR